MAKTPVKHNLKIVHPFFKDIKEGRKNFEIRFDDRDYRLGDLLILQEHRYVERKLEPTGETITSEIKYILRKFKGLQDGYLIIGFGDNERNYLE